MNQHQLNKAIVSRMSVFDKMNHKLVKSYEKNMVDAYVKALKDINLQLKDIYAKIGNRLNNDVTNNVNLLSQYGRLDKLKAIIEDKFKELNPQLYNEIKTSITATFQQGYYTTNYINESLTQLNFSLPLLNADQIKAVVLNPMDAIKWNDRLTANLTDTMRRTQSTITQGVLKGKGYQETARNLKKQLDISYNNLLDLLLHIVSFCNPLYLCDIVFTGTALVFKHVTYYISRQA